MAALSHRLLRPYLGKCCCNKAGWTFDIDARWLDFTILPLPSVAGCLQSDLAGRLYALYLGQDRSWLCGPDAQEKGKSCVDWTTTLAIFGASIVLFAFASWRAARPAEFGKVRMIPWTPLSLVCALVAIFMLVHLVNLMGMKTGR
jgi:hypothetical protein